MLGAASTSLRVPRKMPSQEINLGGGKAMKFFISSVLAFVFALGGSLGASAQTEITLIAPFGAKAPVDQMIPGFEAQANCKVTATYGSGLGTKAQITRGDVFDVV